MKPKKNKSKICHKHLPPHSWEVHPTANQGEANKQLIIAVITISAIIVLGALLLFSDQIAGKAFYAGVENTAGIIEPSVPIMENTQFSLKVKAKIPADKNTVAIDFKLNLPEGVTCSMVEVGVPDLLNWDEDYLIFDDSDCISNQIVFKFATLNYDEAKSGEFEVAQLNFKTGAPAGTYLLDFAEFNVYDLAAPHADLIKGGEPATIVVDEKVEDGCNGGKSNGKLEPGENCLTCPADAPKCLDGKICSGGQCSFCAPNQKLCIEGTKKLATCSADGTKYAEVTLCKADESCVAGACIKEVEPVCDSEIEYYCLNLTQVARCNQDGMGYTLQASCKADETCQAGACLPKAAAPFCTDTDPADTDLVGVIGLNYFEKGTASNGTTSAADKCKSDIILTEKFCKDNIITSQDVDCKSYAKNDYICKDDACVAKSTIPMKIELLGATSGLAVATTTPLSLSGDYKVKVTVSPLKEDLGKHLFIVQLAYNNQSNTYIYESKGNLSIGGTESVEFAHKLANKGEMKIEAFVWGGWPSDGIGKVLLEKVEVKYEIK